MRVRIHSENGRTYDIDEVDFGEFRGGALAPLARLLPLDEDDMSPIADWARNHASSNTSANESERLRGLSAFLRSAGTIVKVEQLS